MMDVPVDSPPDLAPAQDLTPTGAEPVLVLEDDLAWLYRSLLGREPEDALRQAGHTARPLLDLAAEMASSTEMDLQVLHPLVQGRPVPHEGLGATLLTGCEAWVARRLPEAVAADAPAGVARLLDRLLRHPHLSACLLEVHGGLYTEALAQLMPRLQTGMQRLVGKIEFANREQICGWMVDASGQRSTLPVELRCDGRLVASAGAHSHRPDLQRRFGGDGLAGFRARWNPSRLPHGRPLVLTLHEASSGLQVGPAYQYDNSLWEQLGVAQLLAKEFDELRRRLDALAGLVPQALSYSAFPLAHYDLYRRWHRVPPPPRQPGGCPPLHFTVLLDAEGATPNALRVSVDSVSAQAGGPDWSLQLVGAGVAFEPAAQALVAVDPRLRLCVDWPAALRALRAADRPAGAHWTVLLQAGECLDPQAFAWLAQAASSPAAALLYWDEDNVTLDLDEGGVPPPPRHHSPTLRTRFDPDSLLELNVVGTSFAARLDHLEAALRGLANLSQSSELAAPVAPHPLNGSERERLVWALLQQGDCLHLPQVLLSRSEHAPGGDEPAWQRLAARAEAPALKALLPAAWQSRRWQRLPDPIAPAVGKPLLRWTPQRPDALVSVLIPTRDQVDLLIECIDSLLALAARPEAIEIIVADNGSTEAATLDYLAQAQHAGRCSVLRLDAPFNWSQLNNRLAEVAQGEHLLFLNNDTRMLTREWDDILRGQLEHPAVGAVGARLLYDDMTVQHAGVRFGHEGFVGHVAVGQAADAVEGFPASQLTREVSAVTGAFLACRRDTWRLAGGFDAQRLAVTFNDVDWCVRVRDAGLKVMYVPALSLIHHESKSRGFDFMSVAKQERADHERGHLLRRHPGRFRHDPFHPPALSSWLHGVPSLGGLQRDVAAQPVVTKESLCIATIPSVPTYERPSP